MLGTGHKYSYVFITIGFRIFIFFTFVIITELFLLMTYIRPIMCRYRTGFIFKTIILGSRYLSYFFTEFHCESLSKKQWFIIGFKLKIITYYATAHRMICL